MSSDGDRFQRLVSMLPVPWEEVLGMGLAFFINNQEPETVKMKVHANDDNEVFGYSIQVKTDGENAEDAVEFWEEFVEEKL